MSDPFELRLPGGRFVLLARTSITGLHERAAARLFEELLTTARGERQLRELAEEQRLDALASTPAIVATLCRWFDDERLVVAPIDRTAASELSAIDLHGELLVDGEWEDYVPLADLLRSDEGPASTPARPGPVDPNPAPESAPGEDLPTLLRIELGALAFPELGVLTLPRAGAGRWHPWSALTTVAQHLVTHPGARVVALGHRDAAEPVDHARLRAEALVEFLRGGRDGWVAIAAKWGRVRDVQEFLAYLHHERGWASGAPMTTDVADEATSAAVIGFQSAYNRGFGVHAPIHEDGVIGEQTLAAIFDVAHADLVAWMDLQGVGPRALAFHDETRPALACDERVASHRNLPSSPPHQRGRFVDLVIVPVEVRGEVDLGATPAGIGVYEVESIGTLPLGRIRAPRTGLSLEIVLLDELDRPVPHADFEVVTPGGAIMRGTLDANGAARLDGLVEGRCRVGFPTLAPGRWCLRDTEAHAPV